MTSRREVQKPYLTLVRRRQSLIEPVIDNGVRADYFDTDETDDFKLA